MKVFKTERIIHFKTKNLPKTKSPKNSSNSEINKINKKEEIVQYQFLKKKITHFREEKPDFVHCENKKMLLKEGRWTLEEHIKFIKAIDNFGINWKKIAKIIPTRTANQIRSHSQKFFKKLKKCKDATLGIDFSSDNINNINDIINYIKSINKDYDIVKILLYLSEKYFVENRNKKGIKKKNINIDNFLYKNVNENYVGNSDIFYININKEDINDKKDIAHQQIINNNFNITRTNNILINNINFFNNYNSLDILNQNYFNYYNTSRYINNMPSPNTFFYILDVLNNYCINNAYINLLLNNILSNH